MKTLHGLKEYDVICTHKMGAIQISRYPLVKFFFKKFFFRGLRASTANVIFVLNAIIFGIWHTKHQKQSIIRCVKCVEILRHATVPSYVWHGTGENGINF